MGRVTFPKTMFYEMIEIDEGRLAELVVPGFPDHLVLVVPMGAEEVEVSVRWMGVRGSHTEPDEEPRRPSLAEAAGVFVRLAARVCRGGKELA